MSELERNPILDICNSVDGANLWFVTALLGAVGLNLVLTGVLFMLFCVRGSGSQGLGGGSVRSPPDFDDVQSSPAKEVRAGLGGGDGGDVKKELLAFKRQLEAMDRKIDNKRVNEITASYMLHNAHDAIGNKVPTAAQVRGCASSAGRWGKAKENNDKQNASWATGDAGPDRFASVFRQAAR
jgi:hypothetical protein